MKRREFFVTCSAAALATNGGLTSVFSADNTATTTTKSAVKSRYRIGICDWNLQANGDPKSFAVAKELGFDGVQISFNPTHAFTLRKKENYDVFLDAAKKSDMEIASMALGIFNSNPLATEPESEVWLDECLDAMAAMNVKQVLVAFFSKADLRDKPEAQKIVVEKLKKFAPKAEKLGKILAIESMLDANTHLEMLAAIDSPAVQIYYDECNMVNAGYPVYDDMETLLRAKVVSEIHFKEGGVRLGDGEIDFSRIKELLYKYDYKGWIIVEGATKGDWKESQMANVAYLKRLFAE